ncbi:MAG: hypothetical protein A3F16_06830 [Deltaproteobacteria bacterium RIFCSPHIGHO2_12_FULL_43_9]|nr:MAG: hypothetical protein A3F16_06830 [Deltaproteobacteria bacterium RIFCSPHIGHO2_12_FULL_43_9]
MPTILKHLLLIFLVTFMVTGCTKKPPQSDPVQPTPVQPVLEAPSPPKSEDKSEPQTSVEKAIEEAKRELPIGVLEPFINRVQGNYDQMEDLEVTVTQTVKKLLKPKPSISKGLIKVIKPNKIFWLTTSPEILKTVADGTTIWIYDPANKQLFVQPQAESNNQTKIAMLFLSGKGKITDQFIVGSKRGNLYEWKLIPKDPISQVRSIEASVNRNTNWFDSLTIEYTYDEKVALRFSDYKINQGLAARHQITPLDPNITPDFRLHVPPDTKIVESPR